MRKYPNLNYVKKRRLRYRDIYYRDVVVEGLETRRLSATNPYPFVNEGSVADIFRHHYFVYPSPISNKFYEIVDWSTPNAPGYTLPTLRDPDFELMHNRVVARLYEKIRDAKNNANLLNMFGERKEAIQMVSHRLSQVHRILKEARHPLLALEKMARARPRNVKIKRELANKRLEYAYGWAPLMSDINQICRELHEPPAYLDIKATRKCFFSNEEDDLGGSATIRNNFYKKVTGKIKLECSAPFIGFGSSLGLDNPLSLAWELTPYSFVIDWFIPVGTYFENLSALNGFKIVGSSETFSTRGDRTLSMKTEGGRSYSSFRHMSRSSLDLSVPFPEFKNPLSVGHVLNALALIAQLKPKKNDYEYTE